MADRYARVFPEHAEELESSALRGAVRAASTWTPDGGVVWRRWSRMLGSGEMKNFLVSPQVQNHSTLDTESIDDLQSRAAASRTAGITTDDNDSLGRMLSILSKTCNDL